MIFEGVFEKGSPFYGTVIANGTSYDLDMWSDEPDSKHFWLCRMERRILRLSPIHPRAGIPPIWRQLRLVDRLRRRELR